MELAGRSFATPCEPDGRLYKPTNEHRDGHASYSFVLHSQASLTHDGSPTAYSPMMSRQTRRRTSPEDHAVLEAAYQRNSKPDKSERTAIVNRVGLGEKEVSIWFQNRRQNDRRKSRPLLPHEMVHHFRNSVPQLLLHDPISTTHESVSTPGSSFSSVDDSDRTPSSINILYDDCKQNSSRASSIHDLLNPVTPPDTESFTSFSSCQTDEANSQENQSIHESSVADSVEPSQECKHIPASQSPRPIEPESGDTKVLPVMTLSSQHICYGTRDEAGGAPSVAVKAVAAQKLIPQHSRLFVPSAASRKRMFDEIEDLAMPSSQNSGIRLSMSLDGAVKVKTSNEETPSPPKKLPRMQTKFRKDGLRRSYSAGAPNDLAKGGHGSGTRPASGIFGRSRDARTWEFYCDSDARAALSTQAENENNGSAVGAINLIRSQSQHAKCKPQLEKGSAVKPQVGRGQPKQPAALAEQKPKLLRAMSSMARLSGNLKDHGVPNNKMAVISHKRSPSGDSDKENWEPGTRSSNHRLRRTQVSAAPSRDILQNRLPATSSTFFSKRGGNGGKGDSGWEEGDALSGKGHETDGYDHGNDKEDEDLDCIQGLLSLSQGTWK